MLLGVTCLYIAMKMEEIELFNLHGFLQFVRRCNRVEFSEQEVEAMEYKIVTTLKFKLQPDTLYFWFEVAVQLWDIWLCVDQPNCPLFRFKPQPLYFDPNKYEPGKNEFQLGLPNPYRVAVQALDLMTLHFEIHSFTRPNLILAFMAVHFLREVQLLYMHSYEDWDLMRLRHEIRAWANHQEDSPDFFCLTFKCFLENYCGDMLPESFDTNRWAQQLCAEMQFVSQFFAFPTHFSEPVIRKKPQEEVWTDENGEQSVRITFVYPDWLSLEHYAAAHQSTLLPRENGHECSFIMRLLGLESRLQVLRAEERCLA